MNKEEIIAEIQRTAKENGGEPLGRGRFAIATGIKIHEVTRYWARYGDAIREAGFEPNVLTPAFDENFLFDKLAILTRELKKYPTAAEKRIKSLNDSGFPNEKTFDRLGNRNQLVGKLLVYCQTNAAFSDVAQIIKDTEDLTQVTLLDNESLSDKSVNYGFVYLVRGHPGEYKIGRTNLIDRRLSELGATASIEQTLIHEIKTDDPAGIESYWHKRYADKRMKGEWFRLNPTDIAAFKRWKRLY